MPDGLTIENTELRVGLYDFASKQRLPAGASDYVTVKTMGSGPHA